MNPFPRIFLFGVCAFALSCRQSEPDLESVADKPDAPQLSEQQAIDYLTARGHDVHQNDTGTFVALVGGTDPHKVTLEDIRAVNALKNVTEIRIIAFEGIAPEVMKDLRTFPEVHTIGIHYGMPDESFQYFNRFPNVETIELWGDNFYSLRYLPALEKLTYLTHESSEGDFTLEDIRHIVACRNLEKINIIRPVSEEGIALLKSLPHWEWIEIEDTFYENEE